MLPKMASTIIYRITVIAMTIRYALQKLERLGLPLPLKAQTKTMIRLTMGMQNTINIMSQSPIDITGARLPEEELKVLLFVVFCIIIHFNS